MSFTQELEDLIAKKEHV